MTKDQKRKLCEQLDDLEGRIVSLMVRIEKMDDDPADLLCTGCVRDDLRQHPEICLHCARYYTDRYEDRRRQNEG